MDSEESKKTGISGKNKKNNNNNKTVINKKKTTGTALKDKKRNKQYISYKAELTEDETDKKDGQTQKIEVSVSASKNDESFTTEKNEKQTNVIKPDKSQSPIKSPEDVIQYNDEDDGYVAPALMVKDKKENSEIDTALEDEEFRKYYERYYNKKSFSDVVWKDRKKGTRAFIIVILLLVLVIGVAAVYINSKLDTLQIEPTVTNTTLDEQVIYDEEEIEMMNSINSAESLKDYLYQWANNEGELMSSPNVINVLLLGLDSDDALENGGRSDVIMLVSLNKKTEKINISSIYRDTWLYMNVDGTDKYTKFNASYYYGGADGVVKTFEENFKIKIDFYATVDFSSFTNIINALGGITLEVEQYEAEYINRTTVHNIDYGPEVKLNGWEALVYARIRKCDADSDVSRTRRQRKVITTLINELKSASYSDMTKALSSLFGYVKTNLTKSEIISYIIQALKYNWMNYEITETAFNDGEVFGTGWVGDQSTVFMDMPMVAYRLQTAIFENSNIVLDEDRATIFDTVNASRAPMPETTQEETTDETNLSDDTDSENDEQTDYASQENATDINGYAIS